MRFDLPSSRSARENIVPMINVVFLLLIFFLMTAQIVPPAPVEVTPPQSTSEQKPQDATSVYIDANGIIAFDDLFGAPALAELAKDTGPLILYVDHQLDAALFLSRLKQINPKANRTLSIVTQRAK